MKIKRDLKEISNAIKNSFIPEKSAWKYIIIYGIIALILHFYNLGVRPFHHDESLHAYYSYKIIKDYSYVYNPMMHGPFLFFANAFIYLIFGTSNFTARLLPALLGTFLVISPFFIKGMPKVAKFTIATLFLISPTLTYYGRFIRNDIYIVFFGFWVMYFISKIIDTHNIGYWYLATFFWSIIFASKENAYIIAFIILVYILYEGIVRERKDPKEVFLYYNLDENLFAKLFVVFFVIYALLYTEFFVYPKGIFGMGYALKYWWIQHKKNRLPGPPTYYLPLMALYEPSMIYIILAGILVAWDRVKETYKKMSLFRISVWWAIFSLVIYAYAGEKAPWIVLHIVFPFIVVAGFVLDAIWKKFGSKGKIAFFVPLLVLGLYGIYGNYLANFKYPTIEPREAKHAELMVYVQTTNDVPKISRIIHKLKKEKGNLTVFIHSDYTWPFPWYLRDVGVAYTKDIKPYLNYDILITNDITYPKELEATHEFFDAYLRAWWVPQGNFWWLLKKENRKKLIKYILTREVWSPVGGYRMRVWIKKGLNWKGIK